MLTVILVPQIGLRVNSPDHWWQAVFPIASKENGDMYSIELMPRRLTNAYYFKYGYPLNSYGYLSSRTGQNNSYNIERDGQDKYRIKMAVPGFSEADLSITQQGLSLIVQGRRHQEDGEEKSFLHRGLASGGFEQKFTLNKHIKVIDAKIENGLLEISLSHEVPEKDQPRKIEINKVESKNSSND